MPTSSPAEVFISYSYNDEELFKQLEKYLTVLTRSGKIRIWHGRKIPPGDEWKKLIDDHIQSADLVLLLVSVDFLVSEYCFNVEFESALKRYAIGTTRIIPIILHPCPWQETPIGRFEVLPRDGEPIASSKDIAKAFLNVTNSIRKLVETGNVDPKSITYIQDDHLRYIPLEPPHTVPTVKYALLFAAIVLVVITVKSFLVSWSQPQEDHIYSPTPTPSPTSLPTPSVPSPTPSIPTGVQITITEAPLFNSVGGRNSQGHIAGKVSGLKTRDYCVVIYAFTTLWHVQPTTANPMTEIKPDGTWGADIQLGSRYAALVVPSYFNPPFKITSPSINLKEIVAAAEVAEK